MEEPEPEDDDESEDLDVIKPESVLNGYIIRAEE
jgi:hypothetical protein